MILDQERDVVGYPLGPEPTLRDQELTHRRSVNATAAGAGRRRCTDTIEALYEPTFGIATTSPSTTSGIGWSSANRSLPSLMWPDTVTVPTGSASAERQRIGWNGIR